MTKKLCKRCKTGRELFALDAREPQCPYLTMYQSGKCAHYVCGKERGGLLRLFRCIRDALMERRKSTQ